MKKVILISMAAVLVLVAGLYAASVNMKEGKWEVTMTMDLKDIPFPMPPVKYTQCITKKDIEDSKNTVPNSGKKDECSVKEYKIIGSKVTWETECRDGSKGTGEITYSGTSYSGVMKMETTDKKGVKSTVNYKIKGNRVGGC